MLHTYHLPRSTPEQQGVSSSAIAAFLEAVEQNQKELHSFMLLRHGRVAAEGWWSPYGPERPHMLFSLSKSFTSTAIGLAVEEGRLSVDDPVLSFFPDEAPEHPSDHLSSMRVRHLLSMSTGHAEDTIGRLGGREDGNWVKAFLGLPVEYAPGTKFVYNSGATYMLSAIIQKVTGLTLLAYLQPRLFEPLGIENAAWESCPRGINTGGWGLSIKTEDIAKFGQLYLQKGIWNGKRILSEAWVEEATTAHISNGSDPDSDWQQGYGYQFWRCRHGAYRGDGAFGQFCVVLPGQDAVIAITSGENDMQGILNLVWEHLLPGLSDAPLPEDETALPSLTRKLSSLALLPPRERSHSSVAAKVSGLRYVMEANEVHAQTVSFTFAEDATLFTVWDDKGTEHRIRCGNGEWQEGTTALKGNPQRVAASGTWRDEHTFVMTWRFVETPFYDTIVCRFDEDRLRLEPSTNVSFGPTEHPPIEGKLL